MITGFIYRRACAARHIPVILVVAWLFVTGRSAQGSRTMCAFWRKIERERRREELRGKPMVICAWHPWNFPGVHVHIICRGDPTLEASHGVCLDCKAAEISKFHLSRQHVRN